MLPARYPPPRGRGRALPKREPQPPSRMHNHRGQRPTKNLAAQALLNTNIQLTLDLTFGEGVYTLTNDVRRWDEIETALRKWAVKREPVRNAWGVPVDPAERTGWGPLDPHSLALWQQGWDARQRGGA